MKFQYVLFGLLISVFSVVVLALLGPVIGSDIFNQPAFSAIAWSPDSSKIAFTLYDKGEQLYIIDVDGENPRHLAQIDSRSSLVWSQDAERVAYLVDKNLVVFDVLDNSHQKIARDNVPGWLADSIDFNGEDGAPQIISAVSRPGRVNPDSPYSFPAESPVNSPDGRFVATHCCIAIGETLHSEAFRGIQIRRASDGTVYSEIRGSMLKDDPAVYKFLVVVFFLGLAVGPVLLIAWVFNYLRPIVGL